jgi:hypothetical protein
MMRKLRTTSQVFLFRTQRTGLQKKILRHSLRERRPVALFLSAINDRKLVAL